MTHTIKLTFADENELTTRINGTKDEIFDYYLKNNRMSSKEQQVKRIEYIESDYLNTGSSLVYLFVDSRDGL